MDAAQLNALTEAIIGAAIDVHRELGPGLLEQSYEVCLCFELLNRGLNVERQKPLPVRYKNQQLDHGYRIDLLVEEEVVVEVKAIERFERVHMAELIFSNLPTAKWDCC
jgi:GxxExxY protein